MFLDQLRKLSWSGIPLEVRGEVWQVLLGYLPANRDRRAAALRKRRQEYASHLRQHYLVEDGSRTEKELAILRQVIPFFCNTSQQSFFECWALLMPDSSRRS